MGGLVHALPQLMEVQLVSLAFNLQNYIGIVCLAGEDLLYVSNLFVYLEDFGSGLANLLACFTSFDLQMRERFNGSVFLAF